MALTGPLTRPLTGGLTAALSNGEGVGVAPPPGYSLRQYSNGDYVADQNGNILAFPESDSMVTVRTVRDLNIIFLGDSHYNGNQQKAAAVSDTSGNIGTLALSSPLDRMWDGSAEAAFFKADCQINSLTSPNTSQDQGLSNLTTLRAGPIIDMLDCLRRSYVLGKIKVANLAIGGSSAYTWAGERANAFVKATAQANDGDTIVLGSRTYTFRAAPSAAGEVLIGANANTTNQNLAKAVNAETADAAVFGSGTTANPDVVCLNPQVTQNQKYHAKAIGTAGNSLSFTGGNTSRISPCTQFAVANTNQALESGSASSAVYDNAKAKIVGFGTVDLVFISLGTNDGARPGIRGIDTSSNYTTLISRVRTDFPSAKIVITRPFASRTTATQTALTDTIIPAIDALLAANTDIGSIDLWSLGLGSGDASIVESAGVHGTQYGYSAMSQLGARSAAALLSL